MMVSRLAKIEIPLNWGPFDLMKNWIEEFKTESLTHFVPFNLATTSKALNYCTRPQEECSSITLLRQMHFLQELIVKSCCGFTIHISTDTLIFTTKNGAVKSRFMGLQKLVDDGIIFNCNSCSSKVEHIKENPCVAACFLFIYKHAKTLWVTRQIRLEGVAIKQDNIDPQFYHSQPPYAKLRSVLIPEPGVEVDWDELKKKHDCLVEKVNKGELELNPPENLVFYKIVPNRIEFYQACPNEIADRVLFKNTSGKWTYCHITA